MTNQTTTTTKTAEIREALREIKNLGYDKKVDNPFTVRTPDGKTKLYKRFSTATQSALKAQVTVYVPMVVTANTYFWHPQGSASGRKSNEAMHQAAIDAFSSAFNQIPGIEVSGYYTESCAHVRKSMQYTVDGRDTNITGLRSAAAKWGLNVEK